MSETTPNQGLFRVYAALWLVGCMLVAVVALDLTDPPSLVVVTYLAIAVGLWLLDMALTVGRRASRAQHSGHAIAHAVTVTALAVVWPLTIAGVIACLVAGAVCDLRRDRQAA